MLVLKLKVISKDNSYTDAFQGVKDVIDLINESDQDSGKIETSNYFAEWSVLSQLNSDIIITGLD